MQHLFVFKGLKRKFPNLVIWVVLISLFLTTGCQEERKLISYDVDTYLSSNTTFEKKASIVLPSKKDIENSEIIYYALYDNSGSYFQEGMLRLKVKYSNETFSNEINRLKELFETKNIGMGGSFYYDGTLYDSFQYQAFESDIGYCALAYNIDSNSNTISYIVISCENLTYMSVKDAISYFPQIQLDKETIEKGIELGWVFYGSPASAYYFSNTDENPMYIVRNIDEFVWVREDFDYTEDLFVIKDTDIEILFSEAFTGNTMKISTLESHQEKASFIWHSKTVSELEIYARIYEYNDVWYMKTRTSEWWEISDDFLNLLLENKTISIE